MTSRNLSDPSEERASRAMSDIVETRDPRERFGRAGLYPADLDPTEDSSVGRLLPGARRSRERQLSRVVALGGGSGLPVVLRGLRRHLPPECRITAVVTAAHDGGSSGALREPYGVLPPGDIRNCLIEADRRHLVGGDHVEGGQEEIAHGMRRTRAPVKSVL